MILDSIKTSPYELTFKKQYSNSKFSISYRQGFITKEELSVLATPLLKSGYGKHLISIIED